MLLELYRELLPKHVGWAEELSLDPNRLVRLAKICAKANDWQLCAQVVDLAARRESPPDLAPMAIRAFARGDRLTEALALVGQQINLSDDELADLADAFDRAPPHTDGDVDSSGLTEMLISSVKKSFSALPSAVRLARFARDPELTLARIRSVVVKSHWWPLRADPRFAAGICGALSQAGLAELLAPAPPAGDGP